MGSGGSQTLWPPSYVASAYVMLFLKIDAVHAFCYLAQYYLTIVKAFDLTIRYRRQPELTLMVGLSGAIRAIRTS